MGSPRKPHRRAETKQSKRGKRSPAIAELAPRTLNVVLEKYERGLKQKPQTLSLRSMIPELSIKPALQELFPDITIEGRRDWSPLRPERIRQAFKELDGTVVSGFRLLREIVLPCYPSAVLGEVDARVLATEQNDQKRKGKAESFWDDFKGFSFTQQQIECLQTPLPPIQEALQGLLCAADAWPINFEHPTSIDYHGWCLRTLAQVFRDRGTDKVKSLDIALGFSPSGRGRSTDRKKVATEREWDGNSVEIHLLRLSGISVESACARYVADEEAGTKFGSPDTLVKMYSRWRNEPVTAVRLHLGDPLARKILSLPDVRDLIEERFPSCPSSR